MKKDRPIGAIKAVRFIDLEARFWQTAVLSCQYLAVATNCATALRFGLPTCNPLRRFMLQANPSSSAARTVLQEQIAHARADDLQTHLLVISAIRILIVNYMSEEAVEIDSAVLDGKQVTSAVLLGVEPMVALGCTDGSVRMVHLHTHAVVHVFKNATSKPVTCLVAAYLPFPNPPTVIAGHADGSLTFMLARGRDNTEWRHSLKAHGDVVTQLVFDRGLRFVVSIGADRTMLAWNPSAVDSHAEPVRMMPKPIKLPTKSSVFGFSCCLHPNFTSAQFIMSAKDAKLWTVSIDTARAPATADFSELTNLADVLATASKKFKRGLKLKQYQVTTHPLNHTLFMVATSQGLIIMRFPEAIGPHAALCVHENRGTRTIRVARLAADPAYLVVTEVSGANRHNTLTEQGETPHELASHKVDLSGLFSSAAICKVESSPLKHFVAVHSSGKGGKYAIVSTSDWAVLAKGDGCSVAWGHSRGQEVLAVAVCSRPSETHINLHRCAPAAASAAVTIRPAYARITLDGRLAPTLFTGPLLGVCCESEAQFYDWTTAAPLGCVVPACVEIAWDALGRWCAISSGEDLRLFSTARNSFALALQVRSIDSNAHVAFRAVFR